MSAPDPTETPSEKAPTARNAPPLRVLLVGAGAVGIAYGYYLARGGAAVSYLVKPHHAEALRAGSTVYFPRKRGVRDPVPFPHRASAADGAFGYEVLTDLEAVRGSAWDAAFLCMSATALRGPWLEPFLAALTPATTLVMLTPGAEDFAYLAARTPAPPDVPSPESRIVAGLISLVAWQSPLPGENPHTPGIAIWFPPLTKLPFWGDRARIAPILAAMKAGGAPVKFAGPKVKPGGPLASGILTSHIAALEGAGWTFAGLRKSPLAATAAKASRQAVAVLAALQGRRAPFSRALVRPWLMNTGLRVAAKRMPYDFEVYLRYHFTKVRDQTAFSVRELIRLGRERKLPVDALEDLNAAVFADTPTS